jgi:hypothetical protein
MFIQVFPLKYYINIRRKLLVKFFSFTVLICVQDMVKFGGSGKSKQSCKDRKCENMIDCKVGIRNCRMGTTALSISTSSRKGKYIEFSPKSRSIVSCQISQQTCVEKLLFFYAVLRIRDILVRIRICGSVPPTNGYGSESGSGSCYFRQWHSRWKPWVFFLITFWSYIYCTSFFKDEKS